uniref:Uncharacterized protein n=1 Tax=Meloidogyne incognita TaxID=6306 RepID=A0A914M796_MELIC
MENYLLSKNILTKIDNWLLTVIEPNNKAFEQIYKTIEPDFGHTRDEPKKITLDVLNEYSSCVIRSSQTKIIMITGPLSLRKLNKKGEEEFQFKGLFNDYTFNDSIKYSKTTHFFKILLIEIEKEKYCVDILIIRATRPELKGTLFKEKHCRKEKLNEFGEDWKIQLEFIEWYLGIDLNEFMEAVGIGYHKDIKKCHNHHLSGKYKQNKKSNEIISNNIIEPTFEHKFNKICEKESDKQNIRIYKVKLHNKI